MPPKLNRHPGHLLDHLQAFNQFVLKGTQGTEEDFFVINLFVIEALYIKRVPFINEWYAKWVLFLSKMVYSKIPKISHGAYIFPRLFLRGLFLEGFIFGGKFVFQNRLG